METRRTALTLFLMQKTNTLTTVITRFRASILDYDIETEIGKHDTEMGFVSAEGIHSHPQPE